MPPETTVPNLDAAIAALIEGFFDPAKLKRLEAVLGNAAAYGATVASGAQASADMQQAQSQDDVPGFFDRAAGAIGAFIMSIAVENAFGVEVDQTAFFSMGASGNRRAVARALTDKMIEGLTGGAKGIEPSPVPAANYLNVVLGQALESWAIGTLAEIGSCVAPFIEQIQTVGEIGNRIVNALGIGDSSSRVLRPYIDTLVVEPLRRYMATTHRPELLPAGLAVKQYLSGQWPRARLETELAQQGWSTEKIEAHIVAGQKFFSIDELLLLERYDIVTRGMIHGFLRAQGYDEQTALDALGIAETRRFERYSDDAIAALRKAYLDRDLTEGQFRTLLPPQLFAAAEVDTLVAQLTIIRDETHRHLSHADVKRAVELRILPMAAYRAWLEREHYHDEERLTLELLLLAELEKDADLAAARTEREAELDAERATRTAARAKREAEIEAERALARRGSLADLKRAVVRGLIPFARYEDVLRPQYDPDTVAILLAIVDDERAAFLEAEEQRAAALRRAAARSIDVGTLERAVLEDLLTPGEFALRLDQLRFTPADRDLLTRLVTERKRDLDEAVRAREEAARASAQRGIDLARFEQLVRRGLRSPTDYRALLAALGFDEGSQAAMMALLEARIADDRAADAVRRDTERVDPARGLTLEQARRAVLLGLTTLDQFQTFLVRARYTTDAQAVLLAELRAELEAADAARRRREEADAARAVVALPLATIRQAARVGVIHPALYIQRLEAAGFSQDDIDIDVELLLLEIADVQAVRAGRAAVARPAGDVELTLAQLAQAVKRGFKTLDDYRARAVTLGLDPDAVATSVRVLADELEATTIARARRKAIVEELAATETPLAALEEAVRAGTLDFDTFAATLEQKGYDAADAALLVGLLAEELTPA